jgi:hypothetical protein
MKNSRRRINYVGKVAKVRSDSDGYALPEGLPEGAKVEIVGFDIGHFEVTYKGRRFRISMACVENLHQLWN